MKHLSITKTTLFCAMTFALAQPALAVTDEEFRELQEKFDLLAEQVEENSKGSSSKTTIGGYGEMHYNNLSDGDGNDKKEIDFHRFVLYFNHEFSSDIRFFSELELEHTIVSNDEDGYIALEQAFVQFDLNDTTAANVGIFLVPAGIINESHEPPTFYGVERNPIAKYIIPTTWFEGGAMLSGNYDTGVSYDVAIHTGMDGGTNIRGGRQRVSYAVAENLAATARAKYTGIPGLKLSATLQYQDDMTQDTTDDVGSAVLIETHARWSIADFTLTGLYAVWEIDVADTASQADKDKESQDGAYLEASYKLHPEWGVFVRQNQWDNGGTGDTQRTQTNVGVNYWPHEDVVIKADYQAQNDNDDGNGFDGFNLGIGYQF